MVLAITGAEALYADVGHFGRKAIQRAWLFAAIARNAATPVGYFNLPDERTVVMGSHIEH